MTKPTLAVGVGNTTVRAALCLSFDEWPVAWSAQQELPVAPPEITRLAGILPNEPLQWYVASVNRPTEQRLAQWVAARRPHDRYLRLLANHLPIDVAVAAPDRVGMDRLVAAVAANRWRQPGRGAVIVDAGTALTINMLDEGGVFCGGTIFPGVGTMAAALADGTDLLPRVAYDFSAELPPLVGGDTVAAINSGLFHGTLGAARSLIRSYAESTRQAQVFLTGGDASWISASLQIEHELIPDLGLQGIAATARHLGADA